MRSALHRLAFGVLGTGMVVAAVAGVTKGIANAAPHVTTHHYKKAVVAFEVTTWHTLVTKKA